MGKDSTTKTVLIAGGIGLAVYLLANQSFRQKLQDAVAQFSSNIGGGGGGFPSIQMPSIQLPQFSMPQLPAADLTGGLQDLLGGLNAQAGLGGLEDLLSGLSDAFKPQGGESAAGPVEHATIADVIYSLPSWAKGTMGVSAGLLGGYGGYQMIRLTSPILRQVGVQSARAIGGAGNVIGNLLSKTAASRTTSGIATRIVPTVAGRTGGGLFAGFLPALAFGGIAEGAYQIFRTITGQQTVGMTGIPPLDIINLIRGTFRLGPTAPQAPSLFDAIFGSLFGTAAAAEPAAGGSPATVAPAARTYIGSHAADLDYSWCEAYGAYEPAEKSVSEGQTYQNIVKALEKLPPQVGQPPPEVVAAKMMVQK